MWLFGKPGPATRERLILALGATFGLTCLIVLALRWLSAPEWAFYLVVWGWSVAWLVVGSIIAWRGDD